MTGCAASHQARYVYQDGAFGVVGIPENTSVWPSYYREQAESLMKRHFPAGYEIVRAEEVVEGSRTKTVNGTNTAEVDANTVVPLLNLVKVGRTASTSQADKVSIKECRILYKKAGTVGEPPEAGFAASAALGPELYVDPNAEARHHVVAKPVPPDDPAEKTAKADEKTANEAVPDAGKPASAADSDDAPVKSTHKK